jgi:hypothetical protein
MAVIVQELVAEVVPEHQEEASAGRPSIHPIDSQATELALEALALAQERQARLVVD